ncbi:MAG TPA: hypothetical protein VH855_09885 [Acetobacteraceae bacterium]
METLAASAISIIAPYLAKTAEEFAKEAGKEAFELAKKITGRLERWWRGDPVAQTAAENLSKDPERYSSMLSGLLSADLAKDEKFAADLRSLIDEMGPIVEVVQKMEIARGVTGADINAMLQGRVRVEQDMRQAENVTGFKAQRLGR